MPFDLDHFYIMSFPDIIFLLRFSILKFISTVEIAKWQKLVLIFLFDNVGALV